MELNVQQNKTKQKSHEDGLKCFRFKLRTNVNKTNMRKRLVFVQKRKRKCANVFDIVVIPKKKKRIKNKKCVCSITRNDEDKFDFRSIKS